MKCQEIISIKRYESYLAPLIIIVGFNFAYPYLFRHYNYNVVDTRFFRWHVAISSALMSYAYLNTRQWKCKPFHDLVTQPEPNGKYVRTLLKSNFPKIWSGISADLHKLGFNFREMNEYSDKKTMPDVTYKFDDSRY